MMYDLVRTFGAAGMVEKPKWSRRMFQGTRHRFPDDTDKEKNAMPSRDRPHGTPKTALENVWACQLGRTRSEERGHRENQKAAAGRVFPSNVHLRLSHLRRAAETPPGTGRGCGETGRAGGTPQPRAREVKAVPGRSLRARSRLVGQPRTRDGKMLRFAQRQAGTLLTVKRFRFHDLK